MPLATQAVALIRAYNRTEYIEERKRMMQVWADYLEGLRRVLLVRFTWAKGTGTGW